MSHRRLLGLAMILVVVICVLALIFAANGLWAGIVVIVAAVGLAGLLTTGLDLWMKP